MKKLLVLLSAIFVSFNIFAKPVNVNTADAQTIADSLNGIGLKKAQAIVDFRTKNGDFTTVDDLSKVTGIGAKTVAKNKADILLSDSPSPNVSIPTNDSSNKQESVSDKSITTEEVKKSETKKSK